MENNITKEAAAQKGRSLYNNGHKQRLSEWGPGTRRPGGWVRSVGQKRWDLQNFWSFSATVEAEKKMWKRKLCYFSELGPLYPKPVKSWVHISFCCKFEYIKIVFTQIATVA